MIRALLFVAALGCGERARDRSTVSTVSTVPPVPVAVAIPPPQTPEEKLIADFERLHRDVETLATATTAVGIVVDGATTPDARDAARASLAKLTGQPAALRRTRDELIARARELYRAAPGGDVRAAWELSERDRFALDDLDAKLTASTQLLTDKQADAERALARQRLEQLRREKAEYDRNTKQPTR